MRDSSSHELSSHVKNFIINSPQSVFASRLLFLHSILHELAPANPTDSSPLFTQTLKNLNSMLDHYIELLWPNESLRLAAELRAQAPMKETNRILNWKFRNLINLQMNVERLYRGVARCLKLQQDFTGETVYQNLVIREQAAWREKSFGGFVQRVKAKVGGIGANYEEERNDSEGEEEEEEIDEDEIFGRKGKERDVVGEELEKLEKERNKKTDGDKYVISKNKLLELIGKCSSNENYKNTLTEYFRNFRFISIRNMLKSFSISQHYINQTQPNPESQNLSKIIQLYKKFQKKRPVYKNYFRGKQCLKTYLSEKIKAIDRIKDAKKSFKLRFIVDFVKGFRSLFEVTRTVNYNNLTKEKLVGMSQKSQIGEKVRELLCGIPLPEKMELSHMVRRSEKMNRRGFEVLETIGFLLENQADFHDDLTPNSRAKVMGVVFWMYLSLQKNIMTSNMLIQSAQSVIEKLKIDKISESRENHIRKTIQEFGIDVLDPLKNDTPENNLTESSPTSNENILESYLQSSQKILQSYDKIMKETDNIIKIEEQWTKSNIQQISKLAQNIENLSLNLRPERKIILLMDLLAKVTHSIGWVYEMNKFSYVMVSAAKNLLMEGICSRDDEEDDGEAESQEEMWNEGGEGMGDGKGDQGVENEMEFEEQLMGLKEEMENETQEQEEQEKKEDQPENEAEENQDFEKEEDQRNEGDDQNQETQQEANDEGLDVGNDFGGDMEQAEDEEDQKETEDDRMGNAEQENLDMELFEESGGEEEEDEEEENQEQLNETEQNFEKEKLEEQDKEIEEKEEDEENEKRKGDELNAKAQEDQELENSQPEDDQAEEIEQEIEEHAEDQENPEEVHEEAELDFEGLEDEQVDPLQQEEIEDFGDEIFEEIEQEIDIEEEDQPTPTEDELPEENEMGENAVDPDQQFDEQNENQDDGQGVDLDIQNEDQINTQNTKGKGGRDKDLDKEKQEKEDLEDILKEYGVDDQEIEKIKREEEDVQAKNEDDKSKNGDEEVDDAGDGWEEEEEAKDMMKNSKKERKDVDDNEDEKKQNEKGRQQENNQSDNEEIEEDKESENINNNQPEPELTKRSHEDFSGKNDDSKSQNQEENEVDPSLALISESRLNQYKKIKPNEPTQTTKNTEDPIASLWNAIRRMSPEISELFSEILEEQRSSEYQGDFRSGKKLSMRRIVGFIASDFRRDKIWLRKAEPEDRQYRVSIVLDNSLSMSLNRLGELTLRAGLIMCEGLLGAQVRRVNLIKLNNSLEIVRSWTSGQKINRLELSSILESFGFDFSDSESSNLAMPSFLKELRSQLGIEWTPNVAATQEEEEIFNQRQQIPECQESLESFSEPDLEDIIIILSDGRMNKDLTRAELAKYGHNAPRMVFVVLDSANHEDSIINWRTTRVVNENGRTKVQVSSYLEDFPFKYYVIANEIRSLAKVLGSVLSQCMSNAIN